MEDLPVGGGPAAARHLSIKKKGEQSESVETMLEHMQFEIETLKRDLHRHCSDFDRLSDTLSNIPAFKQLFTSKSTFMDEDNTVEELKSTKLSTAELNRTMEDLVHQTRMEHKLADIEDALKYSQPEGFAEILWSGAVKLVKGSFLLQLYQQGDRIERRQEMPEHAFWEPSEAMVRTQQSAASKGIFVYVLSYRWLSKDHPDPERYHLARLQRIISLIVKEGRDIGIFWDFLSLPQADDHGYRSSDDQVKFRLGLNLMPILYAHRLSCVWMQDTLPVGFRGPTYEDSGWCYFESAVSSIMKPYDLCLSMAKASQQEVNYAEWCMNCRASRPPPISPTKFQLQLDKRSFTNGSDAEAVTRLFEHTFMTLTQSTKELDFSKMLWGRPQVEDLAESLPYFNSCEHLNVSHNPFGPNGLCKLMAALPALPCLKVLRLRRCRGLEQTEAIRSLVAALPKLKNCVHLDLGGNVFGDAGIRDLSSCLAALSLNAMFLDSCGISSVGLGHLTDAGFDARQLKDAGFDAHQLKDAGVGAFQLLPAGFDARQLKDAGFDAHQLEAAAHQLKVAGFDARQLLHAGFGLRQLKDAGFDAHQLKDAGVGALALLHAGFDAVDAGF